MLKKSSRPVSRKQALMADPFSLPSPNGNYKKAPASPLFPLSPRLFGGFSPKGNSDIDPAVSPTSILETKPFFFNPSRDIARPQQEPVGLGIVDSLKRPSKPQSRMVLFGSQLKIQIPSIEPDHGPVMQSPIEFGLKNKETQLALLSPARRNPMGPCSHLMMSGCISASEIEMSEEYTCVISHGPNPRTTHIFDNCIVESCGGDAAVTTPTARNRSSRVSDDFLNCCHACKKRLGQGRDIFMYRGEKAFCSSECRDQEMLIDEDMQEIL